MVVVALEVALVVVVVVALVVDSSKPIYSGCHVSYISHQKKRVSNENDEKYPYYCTDRSRDPLIGPNWF